MVQVVFLGHGAIGDEDWKTREGTGGEHRGSHTAAIDCALAESAGGAGAARADDSAHGRWRIEQRGSAALSRQSADGDDVAHALSRARSGWAAQRTQAGPAANYGRGAYRRAHQHRAEGAAEDQDALVAA